MPNFWPDELSHESVYEEWRPVPGCEGYEASTQGRIRRRGRRCVDSTGRLQNKREIVLKPWLNDKYGHLAVNVFRKTTTVHSLVAAAFHGPRPTGLDIRHLNGDAGDNRPENLAYGTRIENCMDMIRHGTNKNTQKTHCPAKHPYDEVNTRWYQGRRYCRQCHKDRSRKAGAA